MLNNSIPFLKFHNPSTGELVFSRVVEEVVKFMIDAPQNRYKVMIGSDSNGRGILDVVSVVAIHRVGNGGRYFWCRSEKEKIYTLRQKIYAEVEASLDLAVQFLPSFRNALKFFENRAETTFDFQIHVDVGMVGETKDLVREITGMVKGLGYEIYIKPESHAATSAADRHVR